MAQEKDRGSELLTQIGEQDGVREKLRRMARQNKLAAFSAVLIALVLTPLGITANGATRWLDLKVTSVQPAEIAKLCMILFLSSFICKIGKGIRSFKGFLLVLAVPVPICLMVWQITDNMSSAVIIFGIAFLMLFVASPDYKRFLIMGAAGAAGAALVVFVILQMDKMGGADLDFRSNRILAWLNPAQYANDAYQQQNSIMAIGSGQLVGKGLNNNLVSSVKNGSFIAEPQTDFIFAVAGEELGFIGCATIILLLALIVLECIQIGRRSREFSGTLICCGVAGYIGFQSFVNICVATGLMPNTGIPLPFVSYGLTSLVTLYMSIGFVLNVGLQPKKY